MRENMKAQFFLLCGVLIISLLSHSVISTEQTEIYNPTLTVKMSNGTNSSVGLPFTLTCSLNISNGYNETLSLYYTFGAEDSLFDDILAGWTIYPLSNRSNFFTVSSLLPSLARTAGEANFPSFEALFTPKSVEASGLYRCKCIDELTLTAYYSPEVYVPIVEDVISTEPTATFTPPSFFAIESEFVAGCTVGGFDPTSVYAYTANFYQISSDLTSNPTQIPRFIASWTVVNETGSEPSTDFLGGNFESAGVVTLEGNIKSFPSFEVKIDPKNWIAKGRYYCTVEVSEHASSVDIYVSKSNEWETIDAISPLVTLTPPESFAIETEFTLKCSIRGFTPSPNELYSVAYYMNSPDSPNYTLFGLYNIANGTVVFVGPNLEAQLGIVTSEGSMQEYPDFEIKILPKNSKAKGKYQCSVTVSYAQNPQEFKSNKWTATYSMYNPTLTVKMSNETNSSVGLPFTLTCSLNISNGYDKALSLYYTYGAEDILFDDSLAGWNFYPLSNKSTFFAFSSPLPSVARKAGKVNFPSFEALFTPKSVEASGLYRCKCVDVLTLTAYYSQEVYVQIVDDGKNAAFSHIGLAFSIYFLISLTIWMFQ